MANVIIPEQHRAVNATNGVEAAFNSIRSQGPGYRTTVFEQDGKLIRKTDVDVPEHVIQHNRELRSRTSWRGEETLKVASVPANLLFQISAKRGIRFEDLSVKDVLAVLREEGLEDFIQYGGRL